LVLAGEPDDQPEQDQSNGNGDEIQHGGPPVPLCEVPVAGWRTRRAALAAASALRLPSVVADDPPEGASSATRQV
jgi:hypothetical protein